MNYYIFEDEEYSSLSIFFRKYYKCLPGSFIYADGNKAILGTISKIIEREVSQKNIFVIMDLIPDNKETLSAFVGIRITYPEILIVPIVCSEYYVLTTMGNNMFSDEECKDLILSKSLNYKECKLIEKRGSLQAKKSFEKFCKFVLANGTNLCFKVLVDKNKLYAYYAGDCLCNHRCRINKCIRKSLNQKVSDYVTSFPLYPDLPGMPRDDIKRHINGILIGYNEWVELEENKLPECYFY